MASRAKDTKLKEPVRIQREISAGGLIWRRGQRAAAIDVVLVKPAGRGTWVLPKGHIETGEGVLEAAMREASEESGLKVTAPQPLGEVSYVYSWRDGPEGRLTRVFKRVHFYLMECVGGDPSAHDREIDEVGWFGLDDAAARASHRSERELIGKARGLLEARIKK